MSRSFEKDSFEEDCNFLNKNRARLMKRTYDQLESNVQYPILAVSRSRNCLKLVLHDMMASDKEKFKLELDWPYCEKEYYEKAKRLLTHETKTPALTLIKTYGNPKLPAYFSQTTGPIFEFGVYITPSDDTDDDDEPIFVCSSDVGPSHGNSGNIKTE